MECNLCHRTTIQIQELKRFVSLLPKSISALASCTTSVYVNLSKNSFFCAFTGVLPVKRVQRYNYFRNQQNFSQIFFSFLMIIFRLLIRINYRNDTHLIIYNI